MIDFSTSMTLILPLAPAYSSLSRSLQKQKSNGQCFASCIPLFERILLNKWLIVEILHYQIVRNITPTEMTPLKPESASLTHDVTFARYVKAAAYLRSDHIMVIDSQRK